MRFNLTFGFAYFSFFVIQLVVVGGFENSFCFGKFEFSFIIWCQNKENTAKKNQKLKISIKYYRLIQIRPKYSKK